MQARSTTGNQDNAAATDGNNESLRKGALFEIICDFKQSPPYRLAAYQSPARRRPSRTS